MATSSNIDRLALYSSPVSDCSARLRIAMNLKEISYQTISINLREIQSANPEYSSINPAETVPTLIISKANDPTHQKEIAISQSLAALEYLEEAFPDARRLLPHDADARAKVRSLIGIVATDIHPLTTPRVGKEIRTRVPNPGPSVAKSTVKLGWDVYWISRGLSTYEKFAVETAGEYSFGDDVSLADVCLLPQLWTAQKFGVDLAQFPTISRIYGALMIIPEVNGTYLFQP
ncbi:maleylacetoacetate isomerase [Thozetella sp. PMI_491]|nr:maleylacetoacetate isomerase [Thozetella sp. PMI_491]